MKKHGTITGALPHAPLPPRGVSAEYLRDRCTLAPEKTARTILAHYLRNWARMEPEETAALLLEEAERIKQG